MEKTKTKLSTHQIIRTCDTYLGSLGLMVNKNYVWSLQGPTLIYLGENNPFKGLTVGDVTKIQEMGAEFLIEPQ
jgi:hypothetical protein